MDDHEDLRALQARHGAGARATEEHYRDRTMAEALDGAKARNLAKAEAQREAVLRQWRLGGISASAIGRRIGVSLPKVKAWLEEAGVTIAEQHSRRGKYD